MIKNILHFFLTAILYRFTDEVVKSVLIMPETSLSGVACFLPPILGLMWGPSAAFGSLVGALWAEYRDWLVLPEIYSESGLYECIWHGVLTFCNCGFWAFIAAYMPYRLWYSIKVDSVGPVFSLSPKTILKFVRIIFLTTLTTSLFLTMTTPEDDMLSLLEGLNRNFGISVEYVLTCFLNDFDFSIFLGLTSFFFLVGKDYPFYRPKRTTYSNPKIQKLFDVIFVATVIFSIYLCL